MPDLNEFIGPKPTQEKISNLEKIVGDKPCFKCNLNVSEYYWNPIDFIMTWTCSAGHTNNVKVNS